MSLRPKSKEDGPVTVYLDDDNVVTYDRIFHNQSGSITLFDVHEHEDSNRVEKGDRMVTYPMHRVEEIQYEGVGN